MFFVWGRLGTYLSLDRHTSSGHKKPRLGEAHEIPVEARSVCAHKSGAKKAHKTNPPRAALLRTSAPFPPPPFSTSPTLLPSPPSPSSLLLPFFLPSLHRRSRGAEYRHKGRVAVRPFLVGFLLPARYTAHVVFAPRLGMEKRAGLTNTRPRKHINTHPIRCSEWYWETTTRSLETFSAA